MDHLQQLIRDGSLHAWLYIPTAVLLGALHGLEPGHSKTMMAAFIVAIRGTIAQAVLLGVCAAFSHSLVIWLLAAAALHYGSSLNAESTEPYFQLFSAVVIFGLAVWMAWRTWRDIRAESHHEHGHDLHHDHHDHGDEARWVDTGRGSVKIEVFEEGVPPVFRLSFYDHGKPAPVPRAGTVSIETARLDGTVQKFAFTAKEGFLESTTSVPEPHEFTATVALARGDHAHRYPIEFTEGHSHAHHDAGGAEYQDAHELLHASEIEQRFAGRTVTTGQIALFGLTGGLLPCPAAFTIVLICLQLKKFVLGIVMVAAFSVGLALTLVITGSIAAWSLRHAAKRFAGFGKVARKLPYLSSALLIAMAIYVGLQGWWHLAAKP